MFSILFINTTVIKINIKFALPEIKIKRDAQPVLKCAMTIPATPVKMLKPKRHKRRNG